MLSRIFRKGSIRGVIMGVVAKAMVDVWKLSARIEGRYIEEVRSANRKYKYRINYMKPLCIISSELQEEIIKLEGVLEMERDSVRHKELLNFILLLGIKELLLRERAIEDARLSIERESIRGGSY